MAKAQLTDAQIKAQIIARAQSARKSEPNSEALFPTEIVPLPSKGLVYPLDNPLSAGQVEIRYMTAKDEDILTNTNYLKQGIALDKLYDSIVIGNGHGQSVNLHDMITGDRSAIMLAARVLGYGSDYQITVTHPDTDKKIPHMVDLNVLKPRVIDDSIFNNSREFEFELPVSKKLVTFKLQTTVEEKAIARSIANQRKAGDQPRNTTTLLKALLISIDGEEDQSAINNFVDNHLLAKDSLMLRKRIIEVTRDYDLTITVDIPSEDFYEVLSLPIDVDFFWPRV